MNVESICATCLCFATASWLALSAYRLNDLELEASVLRDVYIAAH
jgi:hypothetical protein